MITKRIKLGWILALAFLMAFSLTACGGQQDEVQQELVEVTRGDIVLSVTGDGNLSLPNHRKLTFDTIGEITELNVDDGERVSKGTVLAKLDTTSLDRDITTSELAISAAKLAVTSAEVDLKLTDDAIASAKIDLEQSIDNLRKISYPYTYSTFVLDVPEALVEIKSAERRVTEAQEKLAIDLDAETYWAIRQQLKDALDDLVDARERLLRGKGEDVFEQQLLAVKDFWTLRTAELAVAKSESALTQAVDNREKVKLALDKAKHDVVNAQNNLDKVKDDLKKAIIIAPFDGTIGKVEAKEGDSLSAFNYASETIIEIIDLSQIELRVEMDEIDVPMVKPGQKAIIELDALPDLKLEGKVDFIFPLSREEAGVILYEIKVSFQAPTGSGLKSGMTATAEIVIDERSNVLAVPFRAVTKNDAGKSVVSVMAGEEPQDREVVTGLSDSFQTEIVSGLSEGETVVIERKAK
ncbi:efflux RND transporter periplasmic adaptor subunit [Bacteroidota bacterium]